VQRGDALLGVRPPARSGLVATGERSSATCSTTATRSRAGRDRLPRRPDVLRFGNFEILAASEENDLLKQLADYLIREYYPAFDLRDPDVYGRLLDEIARRTAEMIVHWQRVGFVHGVMNTDNMSALGLTIDYGPYGWLEPYDPTWTPNTTDAGQGRYRFGNQPGIAMWNLGCLGSALFPLIKNEERLHEP
jgi:uncharacterized protein YdiU (UPF0061 family)